ncbi:MAG: hypothetical protein D6712_13830, partial [Chloroflexi bacterium]
KVKTLSLIQENKTLLTHDLVLTVLGVLLALTSVALALWIDELLDKRRKRSLQDLIIQLQLANNKVRSFVDEENDIAIRIASALLRRAGIQISNDDVVTLSDKALDKLEQITQQLTSLLAENKGNTTQKNELENE